MKDDKLWKVFSIWIRLRDADENGYCTCCTSGQRIFWKDCDAGHFISRRHLATKYDERNVHAQRRFDNRYGAGKQFEYSLFIDKKYGKGTAELLLLKSRQRSSMGAFEIDQLTKYYKTLVKELKEKKGL